MILRDQTKVIKFMNKIVQYLNISDNCIFTTIIDDTITYCLYNNNNLINENLLMEMSCTVKIFKSTMTVYSRKESKSFNPNKRFSSPYGRYEDTLLLGVSQDTGTFFICNDEECDFNKSSFFNISLNTNMFMTYEQYRNIVNEYKKQKDFKFTIYGMDK